MAKLPTSPMDDVAAFLKKVGETPPLTTGKPGERGRLIFAMDATASREPSWDQACQIQGEMFSETAALGGLEVQLVFYRGFGECRASKWAPNAIELLRLMTGVRCRGGQTQISKILDHAKREAEKCHINALVFVGDALEEDIDRVCHKAGELGLLGVPISRRWRPCGRARFSRISAIDWRSLLPVRRGKCSATQGFIVRRRGVCGGWAPCLA
jgi:hypothetical protein